MMTGADGARAALTISLVEADSGDVFPAASVAVAVSDHVPPDICDMLHDETPGAATNAHDEVAPATDELTPLMVTVSPFATPATVMVGVESVESWPE